MMNFLADENFPFPSCKVLLAANVDVIHIASISPSIVDSRVLEIASEQDRILLTFDRDHSDLIFMGDNPPPPGVIFFRLKQYSPELPGKLLLDLITKGTNFKGLLTVVGHSRVRTRHLWLPN